MELRVLGALELMDGGRPVAPRRRLSRLLLGTLALRANLPTTADVLADTLWSGSPPRSAASNLRSYVAELRRLLPGDGPAGPSIEAVGGGYRLRVGVHHLDVLNFEALVREGRRSLEGRAFAPAAERLTRALALWRGPVLAGLPMPEAVAAEARLLTEARLDAYEDGVEARLGLGRHPELASELVAVVAAHPLRERLWRQLMLSLYRCGRVPEALDTFRRLRELLADELGADPGPQTLELHVAMLRGDPALDVAEAVTVRAVPWQLPRPGPDLVGRDGELAALDGLAPGSVAVVTGTGGAGKTALALRWARRARDRFPDGCLYADLRGFGPDEPRDPADVLAEFLTALGAVPSEPLATRYRDELSGRRVLVILDNARSADQVRPLLPGDAAIAIVTSRDAMPGLVARDGAIRVEVGLLGEHAAARLLHGLIGDRAGAEASAIGELAERCARLPLALRLVAELAAARPQLPLADLARELGDERGRLDLMDAGGDPHTAARSVFSWSTAQLDDAAARAFRLIGLHPGQHLDEPAIGALTGADPRPLVQALRRAHLLDEVAPGRYAPHDLLRGYARELVRADPEPDRRAAVKRLLDQQTLAAARAMDAAYPHESGRRPRLAIPAQPAGAGPCAAEARAWLDGQAGNLLALVRLAADDGWDEHVRVLAATLHRHLLVRGRFAEARAAHELALRVARASGDRLAEAAARYAIGMALIPAGVWDEVGEHLTAARDIQVTAADPGPLAATLHGLGVMHYRRGRLAESLSHLDDALRLYRDDGDLGGEGAVLTNIGLVHEWQGAWARALDVYRQALAINRRSGFRVGEADALNNIAIAYRQSGERAAAARHLTAALAVYREQGDLGGEGAVLNNLGLIAIQQGDWAAARSYLDAALDVHRELRGLLAELETSNIIGLLDCRAGAAPAAVARFTANLAIAIELDVAGAEMNAHYGLGRALLLTGRPDAALMNFGAAGRLAKRTGARSTEADAEAGCAESLAGLGRTAEAAVRRERALAGFRELGISPHDRF